MHPRQVGYDGMRERLSAWLGEVARESSTDLETTVLSAGLAGYGPGRERAVEDALEPVLCHMGGVILNSDAEIPSTSFAYRCDAFNSSINLRIGIKELQFARGIHLDCGKAFLLLLFCSLSYFRRSITANPGINPDTVPASSSNELINRRIEMLAFYIP